MTDSKLLNQAKQGDAIALQNLLSQSLRPQGIWVRANRQNEMLQIALESTEAPNPDALEPRIRSGLKKLQPQGVGTVTLSGWVLGEIEPAWERQFVLDPSRSIKPQGTAAAAENAAIADYRDYTPISLSSPPDLSAPLPEPISQPPAPHPLDTPEARSLRFTPLAGLRLPKRQSRKSFVLKGSDFDPMMLAIIGFVAVYGFLGARNPSYDGPFLWLHYPNLAIHETGHLLFIPFGHFLMVLGGSLTQIAFPAAFTGYFFYSQQYFSSALTLFWTGQNFMDVAVYMADAPYRALPLTNLLRTHKWVLG